MLKLHLTRRSPGGCVSIMMNDTMPKHCGPSLLKRSKTQVVLELMGGVRVGEATGAGDGRRPRG